MRWVKPSRIDGRLSAPPSKSAMIRATAAAALADGVSQITRPSFCDDALAGLGVAGGLGARIVCSEKTVKIKGPIGLVKNVLDCGESGLCLRLFAPIAALGKREVILGGQGTLLKRPVGMIEAPLAGLGVACRSNNGFPPLTVRGPLRGGRVALDGSVSSQSLTGLLMALPLCGTDSEISVVDLKSKPYVDLTIAVLADFGITVSWDRARDVFRVKGGQHFQARKYEIEGDWSGAAFLLVAAALAGRITLENLSSASRQADRRVLDALRDAGAAVSVEPASATVEARDLKAFEFDATDCPDLFPPLATLACFCQGRSAIRGVARLRHKESDRAAALVEEFAKLGGRLKIKGDVMAVAGGALAGGKLDSRGDHRMAMAGAVAGLRATAGVGIGRPGVVSKSYPRFFEDLASVGGDVT